MFWRNNLKFSLKNGLAVTHLTWNFVSPQSWPLYMKFCFTPKLTTLHGICFTPKLTTLIEFLFHPKVDHFTWHFVPPHSWPLHLHEILFHPKMKFCFDSKLTTLNEILFHPKVRHGEKVKLFLMWNQILVTFCFWMKLSDVIYFVFSQHQQMLPNSTNNTVNRGFQSLKLVCIT